MLKIRLQRVGRKHEPVFRIVVTDSKTAAKKNRRFHEIVGSIDMRAKGAVAFDAEAIKGFIKNGAIPSATVHNLLVEKKVIEGTKINVLPTGKNRHGAKEVAAEPVKETAAAVAPVEAAEAEAEVAEESSVEEVPAAETVAEVETVETVEEAPVVEEVAAQATDETPKENA